MTAATPPFRLRLAIVIVALVLVAPDTPRPAFAQPGRIDPGFGVAGRIRIDAGGVDEARAVAVQADGRIVIAGATTTTEGMFAFLVMRLTRDGGLDPSFGRNGIFTLRPGSGDAVANAVAIDQHGRIIAGGYAHNGVDFDFALLRLHGNGLLDDSYGDRGVTIHSVGSRNDAVRSITTLDNGSILVAGAAQQADGLDFVVARYNPDGRLEGIIATAATGDRDVVNAATELDGRITLTLLTGAHATVIHLDQTGEVTEAESHAVLLHLSGTISTVRGLAWDGPTGTPLLALGIAQGRFAVARFRLDGRPDAGFGDDGTAVMDFNVENAAANAAALQADESIIVAGHAGYDIAVVRFQASRVPEGPRPVALPSFPAPLQPPGALLLYDTFDVPESSSFRPGSTTDADRGFDEGAYVVRTRYPAAIIHTGSSVGRAYRDTRVSVSAGLRGHTTGREIVLGCRETPYGRYELFIRPDSATFALYRVAIDPTTSVETRRRLTPIAAGQSSAIWGGTIANRIDLACIGDQLSGAVNGAPLFVVTDPGCWCESGAIALGVSSIRYGESEALFEDLIVSAP